MRDEDARRWVVEMFIAMDRAAAASFDEFVAIAVPAHDLEGRARAAQLKEDAIRESALITLSVFESNTSH